LNRHAKIEEAVFLMEAAPMLYTEDLGQLELEVCGPHRVMKGHVIDWQESVSPTDFRVEAGSNTCTVALRVVGGDKKGSLESETVK
jgi:hypothetical protein